MRLALLVAVLALPSAALGQSSAFISGTFPPPEDVRQPDRTIRTHGKGPLTVLAYSPDGRTLASAGGDKVVLLWDARTGTQATGQLVRAFEGASARITALAFTDGGKALTAVAADRTVLTWEVATGKLLRSRRAKPALAIRAGQEPLLAGVAGSRVELSHPDTGAVAASFDPGKRPQHLVFGRDGKALVTVVDRVAVQLWNVGADASHLFTKVVGSADVRAVAASATHVVVGYADGSVAYWPIDGGEPVRHFTGHKGAVNAVALSSKSDQVAAAGADGLVKIWDVASGTLLCTQKSGQGSVVSVAFSPNGQKMASGGADGTLHYWTVPLPPLPAGALEKITAALPAKATATARKPRKVLVLWRADAILHKSGVPAANKAFELLGKKTGAFEAHFSRDYEVLDPAILARYDAIVFNSTAHLTIPDDAKKQALLDYVKNGGGVVGIHAAIDMWRRWPEGAAVVGATFGGHPWGPSGSWAVKLEEPHHPLLRAFGGKAFRMRDEFYELAEPYSRADRRVLMSLDVSDPATAKVTPLHRADQDFAVSWIKKYGEGRVFYCMFGHVGESFQDPTVLQYYLDGTQYALGDLDVDATPRAGKQP